MVKFLAILCLAFKVFCGFSQQVSSSCEASDSIKELYLVDAQRIALDEIFRTASNFMDSVNIPQAWVDTVLEKLFAVYNATSLTARDTIVRFDIHKYPGMSLNLIDFGASSSLPWMQQLKAGNIPTGFAQFDSLISKYSLHFDHYYDFSSSITHDAVSLRSEQNLNTQALADKIALLNGVIYAETGYGIGDGNNIYYSGLDSFTTISYSIGCGDCPSGCMWRKIWDFKVYSDCSVEFLGSRSYGYQYDLYDCPYSYVATSSIDKNLFLIYPNPIKDRIFLKSGTAAKVKCELITLTGIAIETRLIDFSNAGNTSIDISELPTGMYLLHLVSSAGQKTIKIVRQ